LTPSEVSGLIEIQMNKTPENFKDNIYQKSCLERHDSKTKIYQIQLNNFSSGFGVRRVASQTFR
jgi:hypothetical protein